MNSIEELKELKVFGWAYRFTWEDLLDYNTDCYIADYSEDEDGAQSYIYVRCPNCKEYNFKISSSNGRLYAEGIKLYVDLRGMEKVNLLYGINKLLKIS